MRAIGKRFLLGIALTAFALAIGPIGCQGLKPKPEDEGDPTTLPWNAPAHWEGKTLGIPY